MWTCFYTHVYLRLCLVQQCKFLFQIPTARGSFWASKPGPGNSIVIKKPLCFVNRATNRTFSTNYQSLGPNLTHLQIEMWTCFYTHLYLRLCLVQQCKGLFEIPTARGSFWASKPGLPKFETVHVPGYWQSTIGNWLSRLPKVRNLVIEINLALGNWLSR